MTTAKSMTRAAALSEHRVEPLLAETPGNRALASIHGIDLYPALEGREFIALEASIDLGLIDGDEIEYNDMIDMVVDRMIELGFEFAEQED